MKNNCIANRSAPVASFETAANDNSPSLPQPPSREALRIGIMLEWWERELLGVMCNRPARRSFGYRAWRLQLDEAQSRVAEFRTRIGEVA